MYQTSVSASLFAKQTQPGAGSLELDERRSAIVALMRGVALDGDSLTHLRRVVFRDGAISRDEADALFDLEASATHKVAEWSDFFIRAITEHVVWDLRPTGVVNESQGEWLIQAADRARTPAAFAILVDVMDVAHRVPMWFGAAVKARAARGWPGAEAARAMA